MHAGGWSRCDCDVGVSDWLRGMRITCHTGASRSWLRRTAPSLTRRLLSNSFSALPSRQNIQISGNIHVTLLPFCHSSSASQYITKPLFCFCQDLLTICKKRWPRFSGALVGVWMSSERRDLLPSNFSRSTLTSAVTSAARRSLLGWFVWDVLGFVLRQLPPSFVFFLPLFLLLLLF